MTDWTTQAGLREQVRRRWDKGELLAEVVAPQPLFPLRLSLRGPSSAELSTRFDAARAWAAELGHGATAGYRLDMRDVRHRVIGQNSLPESAWVDSLPDAVRLIGKAAELRAFSDLSGMTQRHQPELLPWLERQPLRALALADDWPRLLALLAWMRAHPRPGIYLRQIDLPGMDTKFVEAQRGLLAEWLDLVMPAEAVDASTRGVGNFARRYGFRDKPARVRFRTLDPRALSWGAHGDGDYTVSQVTFARLEPNARRVFVTENEINFLAFPPVLNSLAIFGGGYGLQVVRETAWLRHLDLHYWGDIDTHGYAILDQLRASHPHARSFLMDRQTLLDHRPQWSIEPQPALRDLPHLTHDERAVFDDLRWRRLCDQAVRLEQERIDFAAVQAAVDGLIG